MEMFMSFFPWQDEHKKEFEFFFWAISYDLQKAFNYYQTLSHRENLSKKSLTFFWVAYTSPNQTLSFFIEFFFCIMPPK